MDVFRPPHNRNFCYKSPVHENGARRFLASAGGRQLPPPARSQWWDPASRSPFLFFVKVLSGTYHET